MPLATWTTQLNAQAASASAVKGETTAIPRCNARCPNVTPPATSTTRRNAPAANAAATGARIPAESHAPHLDVMPDVPSTTTRRHVHRANATVEVRT